MFNKYLLAGRRVLPVQFSRVSYTLLPDLLTQTRALIIQGKGLSLYFVLCCAPVPRAVSGPQEVLSTCLLIDLTKDLRFFISEIGMRMSHLPGECKKCSLDVCGLWWEWSPCLQRPQSEGRDSVGHSQWELSLPGAHSLRGETAQSARGASSPVSGSLLCAPPG